ncbi:RNA methyltransferase [Flavobacterium sp.]|uniref:RNA methyltransferase n=1 Tax=Flavobacterium sp. TaxID=239 RepID=UPI00260DA4CB|nr:RNA methyltransferase [Flavobacterium sp.]
MVSKNQIKLISSLQQKKNRALNGLFIAEGVKVISELLDSHFSLEHLYTTAPLFVEIPASKRSVISETEIGKISALNTANNALAVFRIPDAVPTKQQGLIVALDDIRDPGNLGTIIRLCDWFGIAQIVCSEETVDVYNPKVVQATMGSLARVNVSYLNLNNFLANSDIPVFGTFMDGENIYKSILPSEGIIVMGNEANGISIDVEKTVSKRLSIPRFGNNQKTESLNVATATAIILSEFCRNS